MTTFDEHREAPGYISEFAILANRYESRPEYPAAMVDHISTLIADLDPNLPAVDVGAGTGLFTRPLARGLVPRRHVIGLEPNPEMRRVAQELSVGFGNIRFLDGVAEQLPFSSGSTALVAAACAAHRFDRFAFFLESFRVLAPRGWLALVEYRWGDSSGGIGGEIYSLLEALVPGFRRNAHSNSAGRYEVFEPIAEIRQSGLFRDVHGSAFTWSVMKTPVQVLDSVMALTPSLKAEAAIGEEEFATRVSRIVEKHIKKTGLVELPYLGLGCFASKETV
ncbi:class I SAM-dependent methyltransferase [Rhizobium sp. 1AS11]|uniref:class I SAM-dependent methyltransferase n=1 Tax=Rhizobium acaciae TaxID=2989736 RepID=UPI0022236DF6|nr:class I SAM-dependent methyltransferase [Rhizobium acaciae]MCW1412998.1 class I SAM-dependent methyltransferase [Rhizobium acaciae]MCW1745150.1 class I SAM-dependent methyltransferase [Rhizobium acaciae]